MKKFLLITLVGVLMLTMCGCTEDTTSSETKKKLLQVKQKKETTSKIIYEDKYIKATYRGITENDVITSVSMVVSLENKSDQKLVVLPMDSSVDDTMKQFGSGTLAEIRPGKTFNQAWIVGDKVPEKEVEFSMSICDEDMGELVRTKLLKIEMD